MTPTRQIHRSPISLRTFFPQSVIVGAGDILVGKCQSEPSLCRKGDVFVAKIDTIQDVVLDTDLAIANGAAAIITEELLPVAIPQILVDDARVAHGQLCHELANRPCDELLTVGVMGTHGKTTVSLLAATMMKQVCGRVSYHTSLGASDSKNHGLTARADAPAEHLTQWLTDSIEQGSPAAVLELGDAMLTSRSTCGLKFDVLIVPSFRRSQRGSELEKKGIESAMLRSVEQLKDHGIVIFNADDARLNRWVRRHQLPALGYGLDADAEVRGKRLQREIGEQTIMVSAGRALMPMTSSLVGDHNARNLLAAVTTGYAFGLDLFEVIGGVERMTHIPGRMQRVNCGQPFSVYIDAADQTDRLAVALHSLAATGPVTCVAEIPDIADAQARAAFGRVLERSANQVILTQSRMTNRTGQAALWEVLDGCDRPAAISLIPNRATAIEFAMRNARAGDQVLLAGWGANHWTSGESSSIKSDQTEAESVLRAPATGKREQSKSAPKALQIWGQ